MKFNSFSGVFFLTAVTAAQAGNWTQWRGSNRDLLITNEVVRESWTDGGPAQLWQVEIECDGYSSPLVVDGRIYITGSAGDKNDRRGWIFCLDAVDGKVLWRTEYGAEWGKNFERARTTPAFLDGRLYLISGVCEVVCLDAAAGKILWKVDALARFGGSNIKFGLAECPLIYDGKIICQPGGRTPVAALDIRDGRTVWASSGIEELSGYCSPDLMEINGRRQLVTSLAKHTVGIDPDTGTLLWKYECLTERGIHPNTPVRCGKDRIYVSSGYKHGSEVFEVNGADVKRIWFEQRCDNHFQGAAFYQGRIFTSGGGTLWCFDPADGRAVYTVKEASKVSFCILAEGMMITYDAEGGTVLLLKVDENGYAVRGSFKVEYGNDQHWASPVVAGGVLYLRHGKGIAAFAVGK